MNSTHRFRVAFSFPRDQREYVEQVADSLARRFGEEGVLYDRFHTAEFADADLAFQLPDLYRKESDLIVVVLCGEYVQREWCGLEWRAIYSHIMADNSKQVMLFRSDDAEVRGLHGLEGIVPTDAFTPDEAVTLILQRLAVNEGRYRDFYLNPEPKTDTNPIALSRLPKSHDTGVFEGRDDVLAELDSMWDDALADREGRDRIVSLVAVGGAGKTTVASRWKAGVLAREKHGGVERYFDWSFYSQGTRDSAGSGAAKMAGDATLFIAEALKFFGDADAADSSAPAYDKGARLAELVGRHRSLLILDGLEPLQHPPGPQAGELQDDGLRALFAGLAQSGRGLCLVTTRERITDLVPTESLSTPCRPLDHLTDAAGAAVLRGHSVTGPDLELREASAEVKGHALTLSLMGRFLSLAFDPPDIARRDCFRFEEADHETSDVKSGRGHAFRVFAAYEKWLEREGRDVEVAILRLLGLFDRPATPDCLAALCAEPLPGLSEPLVGLGERQWTAALKRLRDLDLIETTEWQPVQVTGYGEEDAKKAMSGGRAGRTPDLGPPQPFALVSQPSSLHLSLDAHPLLREYFAWQLSERGVSTSAQLRLYEHLCASVPYWPEGRDGLLPLYQAVAHGCQAGRFQEVCDDVYCNRIQRGTAGSHAGYSTHKLGLLGLDLAAVACFFVEPWSRLASELTPADQAWLLSEAAVSLRALNRLAEAREPMRANLALRIEQENWNSCARTAGNLSELELTLGDVPAAESTAAQSVTFADRSDDAFMRMANRTAHADALHHAGKLDASRTLFAEAEALQAERQPGYSTRCRATSIATCCSPPPSVPRGNGNVAISLREMSRAQFQLSNPIKRLLGRATHPGRKEFRRPRRFQRVRRRSRRLISRSEMAT